MAVKIPSLVISEKFYSIQGEGQTMGKPSIFLRLAGCNLLCKSKHWVCDSIEVWQKGVKTDFNKVFSAPDVAALREGVHLIITGGEPMLHQNKIEDFIGWFSEEHGFFPIIEVETNGTIIPSSTMESIVTYWNCSPKLKNSGETAKRRINPEAITAINSRPNSIFKFVINDTQDVHEILDDYGKFIDLKNVVLMPAGENQEQLAETRPIVIAQCLNLGFRYSDRLHIVIWNQKTGV